jgi:multisubunit Na+/H+ antiporter MnhG subunit
VKKTHSIIVIVIGILLVGVIMAFHNGMSDFWGKAILAGLAGAILTPLLLFALRKK